MTDAPPFDIETSEPRPCSLCQRGYIHDECDAAGVANKLVAPPFDAAYKAQAEVSIAFMRQRAAAAIDVGRKCKDEGKGTSAGKYGRQAKSLNTAADVLEAALAHIEKLEAELKKVNGCYDISVRFEERTIKSLKATVEAQAREVEYWKRACGREADVARLLSAELLQAQARIAELEEEK